MFLFSFLEMEGFLFEPCQSIGKEDVQDQEDKDEDDHDEGRKFWSDLGCTEEIDLISEAFFHGIHNRIHGLAFWNEIRIVRQIFRQTIERSVEEGKSSQGTWIGQREDRTEVLDSARKHGHRHIGTHEESGSGREHGNDARQDSFGIDEEADEGRNQSGKQSREEYGNQNEEDIRESQNEFSIGCNGDKADGENNQGENARYDEVIKEIGSDQDILVDRRGDKVPVDSFFLVFHNQGVCLQGDGDYGYGKES